MTDLGQNRRPTADGPNKADKAGDRDVWRWSGQTWPDGPDSGKSSRKGRRAGQGRGSRQAAGTNGRTATTLYSRGWTVAADYNPKPYTTVKEWQNGT